MLNISLQSHERRHGRPQRNSSYGERGDWTRSHHHFGSNRQAGRKLIGWQLHGDGQVARTCGNRQVNADERAEEVHHVDATTLAYHVAIVCGQSNHKVFRSHEHGGGVALGGFEQRHTLTEHHGFLTIRDAGEPVSQANEGGYVFAGRTAVQRLRVGDLFDTSVVHHADAVGNGERFFNMLTDFFRYVKENEKLFRILLLKTGRVNFTQRLASTIMGKYHKQNLIRDSLIERYQYIYCVSGALELLKEWVSSGFPIDERKFAEIIMRMSMQASSLDNVEL